ncbi:hypothetical protein DMW99_30010 [Pseudomonas chlororaphis]|nr:hypothetical protein DMW99_30010 [Pseudomonas chlororaphis]
MKRSSARTAARSSFSTGRAWSNSNERRAGLPVLPKSQPASAKRLPPLRHAVTGHRGARRTTSAAALQMVLHRPDAVLRGDVLLAAALLADAFAWNTVLPVLRLLRSRSQPRRLGSGYRPRTALVSTCSRCRALARLRSRTQSSQNLCARFT